MRRYAGFVLGFTLTGVFLSAPLSSAQAADDCSTTVVDQTTDHVLDTVEVEAASLPLQEEGAQVYVRAFESAPTGDLNGYLERQLAACPGWSNGNGKQANDLLLFMFSMDHQSGIVTGTDWNISNSAADDIRENDMNAAFAEGDFTGGVIAAEDEIYDRISSGLRNGTDVPADNTSSSPSLTIPNWVGFGLVLLVLAGLIGCLVIWLRQRRARNAAAKDRTVAAWTALQGFIAQISVDKVEEVERTYKIVATDLNPTDKNELEASWSSAVEACNDVFKNPTEFDSDRRYSTARYDTMTADFEGTANEAKSAARQLKSFEDRCDSLYTAIQNAPAKRDELSTKPSELSQRLTKLTQAGYRSDLGKDIHQLEDRLREASVQIEAKHYGQIIDDLAVAESLCSAIQASLDNLETIADRLQNKISNLLERHGSAKTSVASGEKMLTDQLEVRYGTTCWNDLEVVLVKAQDALDNAFRSIEQAKSASTMESQSWRIADHCLKEAEQALILAEGFEQQVHDRLDDLEVKSRELQIDIDEAFAIVDSTITSVEAMEGTQDKRVRKLKQIKQKLLGLETALESDRPDLFDIEVNIAKLVASAGTVRKAAQKVEDDIVEKRQAATAVSTAVVYGSSSSSHNDDNSSSSSGGLSIGGWDSSSDSGGSSVGSW